MRLDISHTEAVEAGIFGILLVPLVGSRGRSHRTLHRRHLARRRCRRSDEVVLVEGGGGGGSGLVAVVVVLVPRSPHGAGVAVRVEHCGARPQTLGEKGTRPRREDGREEHFNTVKSRLNGCPDDDGDDGGGGIRICAQWQQPKTRTTGGHLATS